MLGIERRPMVLGHSTKEQVEYIAVKHDWFFSASEKQRAEFTTVTIQRLLVASEKNSYEI